MNNYFYYSKNCESSTNLLSVLHHEGLIRAFKCIDIDKIPVQKLIQSGIKNVPTIVVKSNNGEIGLYDMERAFKWVENIISMKRNNVIKEANYKTGPRRYNLEEMSGTSDSYAYLKTDYAHPKTYMPVGDEETYRIVTIVDSGDKLSHSDQQMMMAEFEKKRRDQDHLIKSITEQNQLNIVLNGATPYELK